MLFILSLLGIFIGVIFGMIPGASVFLAMAVFYPFLYYTDPISILTFYVSLLITINYANSITGILYGIPGDPAAAVTARHGHKMLRNGNGHLAVSSNAISSTIGSIFAIGLFLYFLPNIFSLFKFYNSTIQVLIILLAIVLLALMSHQKLWKTILLFIFGGVLAKIGFDNLTHRTWGTFGIDYLTLGIPFSSMMIGLYILPEILKFKDMEFSDKNKIAKFGYSLKTLPSTLIGSFIGFWCGLVPGVTNILGSHLSSSFVKSDLNKIAAAESANNSGALSSLLPLIILGIPIVSSEVLVYYLIVAQGFQFNVENLLQFRDILYYIPFILLTCLGLTWLGFNHLAKIINIYKENKTLFSVSIVCLISFMCMFVYPIKIWFIISLFGLSILGYFIRKWDTFPVLYGFFLTDLFWENLMRVWVIYT
jgi:putative tricarboxylic transport membrane protein